MSERILVAEDKENLCRLIETTLSEQGYDVSIALGGDAAIHEIQSRPFDLVISDMRMPGASGAQVFREARQQSYQPDVILMTAYGTVPQAVEAMKAGAYDYLSKPFRVEEIKVTVRRVNVQNYRGKNKRSRQGRPSVGSDYKKAIVTLKAGDAIEVFEG